MIIAGIDYSMNSPAICVYNTSKKLSFENCTFFVYSKDKKHCGTFSNIYVMNQLPYESQMERFDNISEWVMSIIKRFNVKEICLEGYSMGSKGAVFDISENGGILKHKLFKESIKFITPAPTQVKKSFTTKGNANKQLMHETMVERYGSDIKSILQCKNYDSPVSDIVDSFALVEFFVKNQ